MNINLLDKIAILLIIIGGINWGLVGWIDYNLVDGLFGTGSVLSRIVYALVGVAALYCIYTMTKFMNRSGNKI